MDNPQRTRKGHKKSRFGCLRCKQRKIKCDEAPGRCGPCTKSRLPCVYKNPTPTTSTEPSSPSGSDATTPHAPPLTSSKFMDLYLLYNFTEHTYKAIGATPTSREYYRTVLSETAFDHDYMMHGVLAISAFDLARRHRLKGDIASSEKYLITAYQHHTSALSASHTAIANFSSETSHLLLAFEGLLVIASMARPLEIVTADSLEEGFSRILELIILLRGMHPIFMETDGYEKARQSPIAPLLECSADTDLKEDTLMVAALQKLSEEFRKEAEPEIVEILVAATEKLCRSYVRPDLNEISMGCFWLVVVQEEYMNLLRSKREEALILLGYWTVTLAQLQQLTITDGWIEFVMKTVLYSVHDTWKPWLRYPLERLHMTEESLIGLTSPDNAASMSEDTPMEGSGG